MRFVQDNCLTKINSQSALFANLGRFVRALKDFRVFTAFEANDFLSQQQTKRCPRWKDTAKWVSKKLNDWLSIIFPNERAEVPQIQISELLIDSRSAQNANWAWTFIDLPSD